MRTADLRSIYVMERRWKAFKIHCAQKGTSMSRRIEELIEKELRENGRQEGSEREVLPNERRDDS